MHSTVIASPKAAYSTRSTGARDAAQSRSLFEAPCVGQDESSGLPIIHIRPGHCCVADHPMILEAGVGSGLAICLIDSMNRVYGMAVLSLPHQPETLDQTLAAQLEALIGAMLARGAERDWLTARVFGATRGLGGDATVGLRNSASVLQVLHLCGITPVVFETGGEHSLHLSWRVPLDLPRLSRTSRMAPR